MCAGPFAQVAGGPAPLTDPGTVAVFERLRRGGAAISVPGVIPPPRTVRPRTPLPSRATHRRTPPAPPKADNRPVIARLALVRRRVSSSDPSPTPTGRKAGRQGGKRTGQRARRTAQNPGRTASSSSESENLTHTEAADYGGDHAEPGNRERAARYGAANCQAWRSSCSECENLAGRGRSTRVGTTARPTGRTEMTITSASGHRVPHPRGSGGPLCKASCCRSTARSAREAKTVVPERSECVELGPGWVTGQGRPDRGHPERGWYRKAPPDP